ncbi:cadherin [Acrasis kona]|uniref:Cadherin n=1 Tax=Acrasis kona TaxID=1008807 RepID=A0AAW2ZQV6_9EUKA
MNVDNFDNTDDEVSSAIDTIITSVNVQNTASNSHERDKRTALSRSIGSIEKNALSNLLEYSDEFLLSPREQQTQIVADQKNKTKAPNNVLPIVKQRPQSGAASKLEKQNTKKQLVPPSRAVQKEKTNANKDVKYDKGFAQNVKYILGIYKDVIVDKERRQRILENELMHHGNDSNLKVDQRAIGTKNLNTPRMKKIEQWAERQSSLEEQLFDNFGRSGELEKEILEVRTKYNNLVAAIRKKESNRKDVSTNTDLEDVTLLHPMQTEKTVETLKKKVGNLEATQSKLLDEMKQLRLGLELSTQEKKALDERHNKLTEMYLTTKKSEEHLLIELERKNSQIQLSPVNKSETPPSTTASENPTARLSVKTANDEIRMLGNQKEKWKAKYVMMERQFQESEKRVLLLHETRRKDTKRYEQEKGDLQDKLDIHIADLKQQLNSKDNINSGLQTHNKSLEKQVFELTQKLNTYEGIQAQDDAQQDIRSQSTILKSDGVLRTNVHVPQSKAKGVTVVYSSHKESQQPQQQQQTAPPTNTSTPVTSSVSSVALKRPQSSSTNMQSNVNRPLLNSSSTYILPRSVSALGNKPHSNLHLFNINTIGYSDKIIMQQPTSSSGSQQGLFPLEHRKIERPRSSASSRRSG